MHGDWGVLDSWRVSSALFLHLQYEICHIESGAFALWSGFHLWSSLLSQVTRSVSDSPVKPRWSLKMNEDPVLSLHLVFQGHVAASNAATQCRHPYSPHKTEKYHPNCPDIVVIFSFFPPVSVAHMFSIYGTVHSSSFLWNCQNMQV